ncbi:cysteine hydrolase family protein [Sphingobium fuliginis]|uniref:Cysteine hydrolase n=1 Tax=Sphingobium fuliginis ATCC 27551 TaxID=1208342 RepID=A0A5B8CDI4_SPHSA|nr:isochorismatase family cysteine hydrolase [Sphingobium fuliginis]QDC37269.1 cysteine hydrolase [Sphingobium fuliginis ATCC 27551]
MPITAIDQKTALIVIDLQKSIAGHPLLTPIGDIIERANALSDAFRRHGLPVVQVVVDNVDLGRSDTSRPRPPAPPEAMELIPDLNTAPSDHHVVKTTVGAFTSTELESYLREQGVTQVVVIGVATSFGVESTVRHARELGFEVTVATDAVTDVSEENHDRALKGIFPRMAETGTTQEIIDKLDESRA